MELSLLLPFILILGLGAFDYGRAYFAFVSVSNAARNGADYASAGPDAAADVAGIREAAIEDTSELLDTTSSNPAVSVATTIDNRGETRADVKVTYTFTTLFPWPGLPNTVDIERTVSTRVAP